MSTVVAIIDYDVLIRINCFVLVVQHAKLRMSEMLVSFSKWEYCSGYSYWLLSLWINWVQFLIKAGVIFIVLFSQRLSFWCHTLSRGALLELLTGLNSLTWTLVIDLEPSHWLGLKSLTWFRILDMDSNIWLGLESLTWTWVIDLDLSYWFELVFVFSLNS